MTKLPAPEQWVLVDDERNGSRRNDRAVYRLSSTEDGRRCICRRSSSDTTCSATTTRCRPSWRSPRCLSSWPMAACWRRMVSIAAAVSSSKYKKRCGRSFPTPRTAPKQRCGEAMQFLCDEWLCDVATDYAGKCTIIAAALTHHRAVAARRAASLLRYCRTPRRRQDHAPHHADHGRDRHQAGRISMVEQ